MLADILDSGTEFIVLHCRILYDKPSELPKRKQSLVFALCFSEQNTSFLFVNCAPRISYFHQYWADNEATFSFHSAGLGPITQKSRLLGKTYLISDDVASRLSPPVYELLASLRDGGNRSQTKVHYYCLSAAEVDYFTESTKVSYFL